MTSYEYIDARYGHNFLLYLFVVISSDIWQKLTISHFALILIPKEASFQ